MAFILSAMILAVWAIYPSKIRADNKNFAGVMPFVTSSGLMGFFNQNDGKIYIYNNPLSECLYEGQVTQLGEAVEKIRAAKSVTVNTYELPK